MRLLAGVQPDRALTLPEHDAVHGPPRADRDLMAETHAAGLTGRGGGGFPVARKLETAARSGGRAVVVVNAAESEPASAKDETLLRLNPHLVLDGADAVAAALGTREVYVWVHRSADATKRTLFLALEERRRRASVRTRVIDAPDRYVAGDASAAVRRISGGPALPNVSRYRTAERGVRRRPTVVANVETYGHLALLARHGADWFRMVGTPEEPGTRLLTVRHASPEPHVLEVPIGTSLSTVLAGANTAGPFAGVLLGGYAGTWLASDQLPLAAVSRASLSALGADLGAGVILALPADRCALAETERLLWWLASESTGQCGPCIQGLPELARRFGEVVRHGREPDVEAVEAVGGLVLGRGACSAPDGAVRLAASALRQFAGHVGEHRRRGPCRRVGPPVAPLPPPRPVRTRETWR